MNLDKLDPLLGNQTRTASMDPELNLSSWVVPILREIFTRKRHSQRLIRSDASLNPAPAARSDYCFSIGCDLYTLVKLHQFCINRKLIVIDVLVLEDAWEPFYLVS